MKEWKSNLEKETDDDRRQIIQGAVNVAEQTIDDARLEMRQVPRSEEGKHRYREIVSENDIRTKLERFRVWAKETWGR
jgi:vacuolar-type H+-ATPase subunit H